MAEMENSDIPYGLCKYDSDFLQAFHSYLKDLRNLTISNIEFYQRGRSSIHARYYASSCILLEHVQSVETVVIDIVPHLHTFDFSDEVHANGYRSFIQIVNRCCLYLLQLCRHINVNKTSLLFRSAHHVKELEAYVETLGQLIACLGYLKQLITYSKDGDLFVTDEQSLADTLLLEVEMLNTDCFYGRALGFQFCESMQKVLQGVLVVMATFSECYEETSQVMQLASSLFNSGKYVMDQDLRARQVVNVTRTADIKFCKAFWSILESPFLHQVRSFTFPNVEVSEVISLDPVNFEIALEGAGDETVTITPACAHTGPAPVKARLISHTVREGMSVTKKRFARPSSSKSKVQPKSAGLLFHCHGGGFVAQSSQSHENYLRVWAQQLQVPIFSVDYALAPDLPFPRALEECFYAYAWALKNADQLGWTGERVCFAGDSAGGNLVISVALRAISYQIRVPDGIMAAYTPFLVQYTPSPARLMSMIDPLLPVGILTRCLAEYAGIADEFSSALTKPIFCNPGNVESWEVVDEQDVTEDSIGAQITNENDHTKAHNKQSSNENKGCLACEHGKNERNEQIQNGANSPDIATNVKIDCDNNEKEMILSQTSQIADLKSRCDTNVVDTNACDTNTDCDTIDEEFVVCDLEDIETEEDETSVTSTTILERTNNTEVECVNHDLHNSESQTHSVDNIDAKHVIETTSSFESSNVVKPHLNDSTCGSFADTCTSIEDALRKIDNEATVNIVVDSDHAEETQENIEDASQMYAVCTELLEENNVEARSLQDTSDMSRMSCHSLADMVDDMDGQFESLNENGEIHNGANCNNISQNRIGANLVDENLNLKFKSETTETKPEYYPCLEHNMPSITQNESHDNRCHNNMDITNTDAISSSDIMNKDNQDFGNGDKEETDGLSQIKVPTKAKLSRRAMSLDLKRQLHHDKADLGSPLKSPTRSQSTVFRSTSPLKSPSNSPQLPVGSRSFEPKRYSVQRNIAQSPIQLFRHLPIVKNMYMSPILAPDDVLLELPEVHLVACHFDPLLDDSVTFAKKLASLDKKVTLQVVDSLPHGFLCFSDTSPEAKQAANLCLDSIKKVLHIK